MGGASKRYCLVVDKYDYSVDLSSCVRRKYSWLYFTSAPAGDGATNNSPGGNYLDITNYGRFNAYGNPGGQRAIWMHD